MSDNRYFKTYSPSQTVTVEFERDNTTEGKEMEITGILGKGGFSVVYSAIEHNGAERRIKTFNPENKNGDNYTQKQLEEILINDSSNQMSEFKRSYKDYLNSTQNRADCVPIDKTNMICGKIVGSELTVFIFDPMNDITLDQYIEDNKGNFLLGNLVHIAKSILSFTKLLRENASVHFDIKPGNILINAITGDFLGLIDYGSAYKIKNEEGYRSYIPAISSKMEIDNVKKLRYNYDIYCSVKWFVDLIISEKIPFNIKSLKKTTDFVNEAEQRNCDVASNHDPEQLYYDIQDELSAINTTGWARMKSFCEKYAGDSELGDLLGRSIKSGSKSHESFKIDDFCGNAREPIIIKCNFYKERKEICNELVKRFMAYEGNPYGNSLPVKTIVAAPVTINISMKTELEIQNAIAAQVSDIGLFGNICNTLSSKEADGECHKLILVINIRTYNRDTIANLRDALYELYSEALSKSAGKAYEYFSFVIVSSAIYEQDNKNKFSRIDLCQDFSVKFAGIKYYEYEFEYLKSNLSNVSTESVSLGLLIKGLDNAKDCGIEQRLCSVYHIKYFNGLSKSAKSTEAKIIMSGLNMVMSALDGLSDEKAMAFVQLVYRVFSNVNNIDKADKNDDDAANKYVITKSVNYHAPLEEKDIILIAERTGIINILGRGMSSGTLLIEIGNPEMVREFLACAVYERYSVTNASKYKEIFQDQPLDGTICNIVCTYIISGGEEAKNNFKNTFKHEDPISRIWNHGLPLHTNRLDGVETYTAINLRMIYSGIEEKYEEPAQKTGHFVRLNEDAKSKYNNEYAEKAINGITKKQNPLKWMLIWIIIFACIVFGAIMVKVAAQKNEVDFNKKSDVSLIRIAGNNEAYSINHDTPGSILAFNDDFILVPVNNTTLLENRLSNFEFVSDDGIAYPAEVYTNFDNNSRLDLSDPITKDPHRKRPTYQRLINGKTSYYVTLRFPERFARNSDKPIHITSVKNRFDDKVISCDFYFLHKDDAVQIKFEQLPSVVSNTMEYVVDFSSNNKYTFSISPFDENTPFEECFFAGNGQTYIPAKSVEKISNENERYLVRTEGVDRLAPESGTNELRIFLDARIVSLSFKDSENISKRIPSAGSMDVMGASELVNYDGLVGKQMFICETGVKIIKSGDEISSNVIMPQYEFFTMSATNAKNIVLEPRNSSALGSTYYMNSGISGIIPLSKDSLPDDGLFEYDYDISNENGQFGRAHIFTDNIHDQLGSYDNEKPTMSPSYIVLDDNCITVRLTENDNFPLAGSMDNDFIAPELISIFGAKYDPEEIDIRFDYVDYKNVINTKAQWVTITIPVSEYYASKEDVSVLIKSSLFKDSAGNNCITGNILYGKELVWGEPYYDSQRNICVDVTFPYNSFCNLTPGHIGKIEHKIVNRSNLLEKIYTKTIKFAGTAEFSELDFTVNGGTMITTDGEILTNGFIYNFASNLIALRCKQFGDVVQAEILLPDIADKHSLDVSKLALINENGESIRFDSIEITICGNSAIATFTGINENTAKLRIDKGFAVIRGEVPSYTGEYESDIKELTFK